MFTQIKLFNLALWGENTHFCNFLCMLYKYLHEIGFFVAKCFESMPIVDPYKTCSMHVLRMSRSTCPELGNSNMSSAYQDQNVLSMSRATSWECQEQHVLTCQEQQVFSMSGATCLGHKCNVLSISRATCCQMQHVQEQHVYKPERDITDLYSMGCVFCFRYSVFSPIVVGAGLDVAIASLLFFILFPRSSHFLSECSTMNPLFSEYIHFCLFHIIGTCGTIGIGCSWVIFLRLGRWLRLI